MDRKPNKHIFVFTPSVGVEHFFGGSRTKACFAHPNVGVVGICGVYVILILRA